MSRQEEIRREVNSLIHLALETPHLQSNLAYQIINYLHSQGCVLRVDRELPKNPYLVEVEFRDRRAQDHDSLVYAKAQRDMVCCSFTRVY